jgi:hypothetical protein
MGVSRLPVPVKGETSRAVTLTGRLGHGSSIIIINCFHRDKKHQGAMTAAVSEFRVEHTVTVLQVSRWLLEAALCSLT